MPSVDVAPQEYVPLRVTGTMNLDANWESNDNIRVTPVFKISPKISF